jgi:hypothetical protein
MTICHQLQMNGSLVRLPIKGLGGLFGTNGQAGLDPERIPPRKPGIGRLPVIEDAPGCYVRVRAVAWVRRRNGLVRIPIELAQGRFCLRPHCFLMFEMAITRKWGRWTWTVSDNTGRVVVSGWEFSRRAASRQAARALFQALLVGNFAGLRQRPLGGAVRRQSDY